MPERTPKQYRLTPTAQADLANIWIYTAETWSPDQADAYLHGIRATLDTLLDNPRLARERTEIDPPVRIHPHRSHLIVYRIEAEQLIIVRVRHGRENWASEGEG